MKKWYWRARYYALAFSGGSLFLLGGCGLSDQQLASIWQSVLQTALTTIITNAIASAFSNGA